MSGLVQNGGVYMFSNVHGCDGERTYYDGCSSVATNGEFVVQGAQFTIKDVVSSKNSIMHVENHIHM